MLKAIQLPKQSSVNGSVLCVPYSAAVPTDVPVTQLSNNPGRPGPYVCGLHLPWRGPATQLGRHCAILVRRSVYWKRGVRRLVVRRLMVRLAEMRIPLEPALDGLGCSSLPGSCFLSSPEQQTQPEEYDKRGGRSDGDARDFPDAERSRRLLASRFGKGCDLGSGLGGSGTGTGRFACFLGRGQDRLRSHGFLTAGRHCRRSCTTRRARNPGNRWQRTVIRLQSLLVDVAPHIILVEYGIWRTLGVLRETCF